MKIGTFFVALAVATGSISLVIWGLKNQTVEAIKSSSAPAAPSPDAKTDAPALPADPAHPHGDEEEPPGEPPQISPTGPHPKVVVDKSTFNFGAMEVNQKDSHTFVISNEGKAPLKLVKGSTTCKCTLSKLALSEIPPGKSADITLTWKPVAKMELFRQVATIYTNDPEHKKLELSIEGLVDDKLQLSPSSNWNMETITANKTSTFTGSLYSPMFKEFKILGIKSSNPLLSATYEPMNAAGLKDLKAKAGYSIHVTLAPGIPVGPFEIKLTVQTDVPESLPGKSIPKDAVAKDAAAPGKTVDEVITVTGTRRGPLQIMGNNWVEDEMLVGLGSLDVAQGKKVTLNMFVTGAPEEGLKFTEVKSKPEYLKVSLEQDAAFKGKKSKRYLLVFEVPPGKAMDARNEDMDGWISVKTNHPDAPKVDFKVKYRAY